MLPPSSLLLVVIGVTLLLRQYIEIEGSDIGDVEVGAGGSFALIIGLDIALALLPNIDFISAIIVFDVMSPGRS